MMNTKPIPPESHEIAIRTGIDINVVADVLRELQRNRQGQDAVACGWSYEAEIGGKWVKRIAFSNPISEDMLPKHKSLIQRS